jgi:hypothetical protein
VRLSLREPTSRDEILREATPFQSKSVQCAAAKFVLRRKMVIKATEKRPGQCTDAP